MKKIIVSGVVAVLVALLAATVVFANGLDEAGDAGDLPANAQQALGVGPLTTITGSIGTFADVDMYKICLQGGRTFSATVPRNPIDAQLFLFDSAGLGIYSNDDDSDDFGPSILPAGHALTPLNPGIYYLAVNRWDVEPFSVGGAIFTATHLVDGPTGPGGGFPVTGWNTDDGSTDTAYQIILTGANYLADADRCPQPVGGLTSFSSGSGSSSGSIALFAGGVATVVAIAASGWYARRRWLRS